MSKLSIRIFLLFVIVIFLSGCPSWWKHDGSKPPSEAVVKARQEIAYNREAVTLLVPRIKEKFKGKEFEENYVKAQTLYDEAMIQNNSWVTSLKLGIENNENLESSQAFKDKAKVAGGATNAFVEYGKQLTQEISLKSVVLGFTVGDFVNALVENGIVIWKAYRAEEQADRIDQAARTEKELKWLRWEQTQ